MSGKLQTTAQERDVGVGYNSSVHHQLKDRRGLGSGWEREVSRRVVTQINNIIDGCKKVDWG